MAELAYTPEVFPMKPAERGPMDRVKRKVFDFVKSQTPSAHARRTMERYDWVGDQLDGASRELYEKMRPAAEKAAKVAGVSMTSMEIGLALQVAVGASLLLGTKAGRLALVELVKQAGEQHPVAKERILSTMAKVTNTAETARTSLSSLVKAFWEKFSVKAPDLAATAAATGGVATVGAVIHNARVDNEKKGDAKSWPQVDQNRKDTVLPPELDVQMAELRDYSDTALAQSKMDQTSLGRLALIDRGNTVQLLIREINDPSGVSGSSRRLMRLVDRTRRQVISVDLSDITNRGWVTVYDDDAFASATGNMDKGVVSMNLKGKSRKHEFDVSQDLDSLLNFIRTHRVEPEPPPPA